MHGERSDDVKTTEELTEATAVGLRWVTYTRIGLELLMLAGLVVLARLIPPAAFGVFAVVVIFQELALTVPSEGVGSALVQRRSVERRHLQGGLMLGLLGGALFAAIALAVAEFVARPIYGGETADLIVLASPCFLLGAATAGPLAVLRRRLDFGRVSIVEIASTATRLTVTIALAVGGLDAPALVIGHLSGMLAGTVVAWTFAPLPPPRWNRQAVRELMPYSGPATLACFAWTGFRNGDYAIISARLGAAQAGLYWRAYQLAVEYQKKISSVMTQMAFPVLARAAGEDEMLALRRRMVRALTVILFPLLIMLVLLAPALVPWLFGEVWAPAVVPMQILALGGAATLVIDAVGPALMASGRAKALLAYGVGHFVLYAGAVVLVAGRGLAAVAIAATVVHTIFVVIAYQVMLRRGVRAALRAIWVDVSAATLACGALAAVAGPVSWALANAGAPVLVQLALVGASGGLAYLGALRLAFPAAWADLSAVLRRVLPGRALALLERLPGLRGEARRRPVLEP